MVGDRSSGINTAFPESVSRKDTYRRIDRFHLPDKIIGKVEPSPKRFGELTDNAIKKVEAETQRAFTEEEKARLRLFGQTAYQINALVSGGQDSFVSAKLSLAYEIGRTYSRGTQETILAYGNSSEFSKDDTNFSAELLDVLRDTGKSLELCDTDNVYQQIRYVQLLKNIHQTRRLVLSQAGLAEVSRSHPYPPLIDATYILTRYMIDQQLQHKRGVETSEARELGALAFQLPFGEVPPNSLVAADFRTRVFWNRLINGVRDIILTDYFPEVASYAGGLVSKLSGISDSSNRLIAANSVTLSSFFPKISSNDLGHLIATNSHRHGDLPARTKVIEFWRPHQGMVRAYLEVPQIDGHFLDEILDGWKRKNNNRGIEMQASGIKSDWEIVAKTLRNNDIAGRLEKIAEKKFGSSIPSSVTRDLTGDKQVLVDQARLSLFNTLLAHFKKDKDVSSFIEDVRRHITQTPDIVRSRVFIKGKGALDAFCQKHVLTTDPEAFILLERPGKSVQKIRVGDLVAQGKSIESTIAEFQSQIGNSEASFAAVFVTKRIKLNGSSQEVTAELQLGREVDAKSNWGTRETYKFTV